MTLMEEQNGRYAYNLYKGLSSKHKGYHYIREEKEKKNVREETVFQSLLPQSPKLLSC